MRNGLEQIARNAGKIILDREAFRVEEKEGHANYVTTIDQHVQDYLEDALLTFMPGSVVIGEEKENDALGDEPTWIIDPVDGTTNLIHDFRLSSVSIALLKNKKPVLGVVYQPYTDELFSAEAGKGCFLNGKPVHTAKNDLILSQHAGSQDRQRRVLRPIHPERTGQPPSAAYKERFHHIAHLRSGCFHHMSKDGDGCNGWGERE